MTPTYEETDPLKHGIYAQRLTRQELNSLRKMPYDDLGPEIAILRFMISRMLARCTEEKDDQTAALMMNSITHAVRSLNTLVRTYAQLDDDRHGDDIEAALASALKSEPFYLTGDPPPLDETPFQTNLTPEEEQKMHEFFEVPPTYSTKTRPTHFRPLRRQPSPQQLRRRKARAAAQRQAPTPAKKPTKKSRPTSPAAPIAADPGPTPQNLISEDSSTRTPPSKKSASGALHPRPAPSAKTITPQPVKPALGADPAPRTSAPRTAAPRADGPISRPANTPQPPAPRTPP